MTKAKSRKYIDGTKRSTVRDEYCISNFVFRRVAIKEDDSISPLFAGSSTWTRPLNKSESNRAYRSGVDELSRVCFKIRYINVFRIRWKSRSFFWRHESFDPWRNCFRYFAWTVFDEKYSNFSSLCSSLFLSLNCTPSQITAHTVAPTLKHRVYRDILEGGTFLLTFNSEHYTFPMTQQRKDTKKVKVFENRRFYIAETASVKKAFWNVSSGKSISMNISYCSI